MDQNIVKNKWSEIRDQIDDWWEELTEDDLDQINGSHIQLVYVLQERYGYSHQEAQAEVEKRITGMPGGARKNQDRFQYASRTPDSTLGFQRFDQRSSAM